MDKERILAARKKLREYQLSKQQNKGRKESIDSDSDVQIHNHDHQIHSHESTPETNQNVHHNVHPYVESQENNGEIENDVKTPTESAPSIHNQEQLSFSSTPTLQETTNIQSYQDNEIVNGNIEIPSNEFVPTHSRSSSTVSSQMVHGLVDNSSFEQNVNFQQNETVNPSTNPTQNSLPSLQKEHLLQMADAVASALDHDQGFDESELNSCVLKQKNQFLINCLEEQKQVIHQLNLQLNQSNSRKAELEAIVSTKESEYENKLMRELGPLKEQIKLDAQTIGILVAEKAELTATNSQLQITIQQKTDDVKELFGKFKSSQQRIAELESELSSFKNSMENLNGMYAELQKNYQQLEEMFAKLKKENETYEMDTSELRQKLSYKNTELTNLQQELQEKIALLQLSEIRIQQLSNTPQELSSLETQHHTNKVLEQQLSQMKQTLESVSGEKDEVSKKYQSYIQQLDERHTKLLSELEASKKIIAESEIREQSYIQRLSELETQLQNEKEKDKPPQPLIEDQSEKISMLTKSMDNLVLEQEQLHSLINDKDNQIETLKRELKELQEIKEQSVDVSKLATALQSEQLGASRAVSQNQQLKYQLDEMHDAFITLSNTKLDLTEQLQAERTIGKKLNAQLNQVEKQMEELKEQLALKEEALEQLEKEKLQAAQIQDQIQHYQAQSHSATTLQEELQKALYTIEALKKENQTLLSKINDLENNSTVNENLAKTIDETESQSAVESENSNAEAESPNSNTSNEHQKTISVIPEYNSNINLVEPFKKLEKRFKETMEKVADLTDEKQRLEHLVTQLQGETETIGEYITLYQKQRSILNQKAKERDNTFRLLLEQRNQQQDQLRRLKILVADLIKAKTDNSTVSTGTVAEEGVVLSDQPGTEGAEGESNKIEVIQGHVNKVDEAINQADKTTSQILDLLTEIKDCNSCILEPNFQPCPCCSGKLLTV